MDNYCTGIRTWLIKPGQDSPASLIDQAWIKHIAGCPRCRGALTLLMAELLHVPYPIDRVSCEQCLDDLAAFIDIEHLESSNAAVQSFPTVWWHLLTCTECAENYRLVRELVHNPPSTKAPPLAQVQLKRSTLRRLMHVRSNLQVAWGNEANDIVVAEQAAEGYDIQLSIRHQETEQWLILVHIAPPVAGEVLLVAGEVSFHMALDANGRVSQAVSSDLLTALEGPDLMVSIIARPEG